MTTYAYAHDLEEREGGARVLVLTGYTAGGTRRVELARRRMTMGWTGDLYALLEEVRQRPDVEDVTFVGSGTYRIDGLELGGEA